MSRKPVEREREHDLACPLRPAMALLSVFEPFQLAADIDEHAGKLRSNGFNRSHDALLGGDDLIAQVGGAGGGSPSRPVGRRERRPVRRHPRTETSKPIIGSEPLAGFKLLVRDERPPNSVFPALEPAKWALSIVDEHRPPGPVDLLQLRSPHLMLLAKRIITGFRPTKHGPSNFR
jgi:hypothetical protein